LHNFNTAIHWHATLFLGPQALLILQISFLAVHLSDGVGRSLESLVIVI